MLTPDISNITELRKFVVFLSAR